MQLPRIQRTAGCALLVAARTVAAQSGPADAGPPASTVPPTPASAPANATPPEPPPDATPPPVSEGEDFDPEELEAPSPGAEVMIHVTRSAAQRLRQSSAAVTVVETKNAQRQTADLGEVLARTQGVAVRRSGGLGSEARFSLNGLYDDQIRFFLDGVPLELAGYPFGLVNVPVNLVERVDVYRGVVPVRFGADALGGAVNLVSDQSYETHVGASVQLGSFDTLRASFDGRYRHEPTGLVLGASAFLDSTRNNYLVDVDVADERGRLSPATVTRFHDAYHARGATLEAGVVDQPWAERLVLQGFASSYDKELQHNVVMTVPYGEVHYSESVYGLTGRYEAKLPADGTLELVGNYAHRRINFWDAAQWVYDWYGQRVRARRVGGEIESNPTDQSSWQDAGHGRATLSWQLTPEQSVLGSLSFDVAHRTGDERLQADPAARDPLTAQRDLFSFVGGVEHELTLFEERLSNSVFAKTYVYRAATQEPLPGGVFRKRDQDSLSFGVGDAFRYLIFPWLTAKASYEYATRLPRPDEVFGDGVLVHANLELKPEVSHNANIGPRVELRHPAAGVFSADINGFLRDSDRLVVLLGNDRFSTYQNVYAARSLGVEGAVGWESAARLLSLDGTLTWQSVRNSSDSGTFGDFEGDRIPNRPYLFASWGARLHLGGTPPGQHYFEAFYTGRYVHEFFRGWESQGLRAFKQVIDAQQTHAGGLSVTSESYPFRSVATLEVDNLTDAKAFDDFGVQRPGRALYVKLTMQH